MVKRIFVLVLALSMVLTCMASVGVSAAEPIQKNIDVPADIEVKNTLGGSYQDGPLVVTVNMGNPLPAFDFKATLDLEPVREAFNTYCSKAYFEKLFAKPLTDQEYEAYKADLTVKGQMITTVNVPAGLGLYWATGSLVSFLTSVLTNTYFKYCDMEKVVEKSKNKAAKKIEKKKQSGKKSFMDKLQEAAYGAPEENNTSKSTIASASLKNYTSNTMNRVIQELNIERTVLLLKLILWNVIMIKINNGGND